MQLDENSFLAGRPDQVTAQVPRLEIEQSRNVLHSQPKAEIRVVVGIYLHDLNVVGTSLCDLQQNGLNDLAGFTPRRPERDQDGSSGLQNFRLEIRLAKESQI